MAFAIGSLAIFPLEYLWAVQLRSCRVLAEDRNQLSLMLKWQAALLSLPIFQPIE